MARVNLSERRHTAPASVPAPLAGRIERRPRRSLMLGGSALGVAAAAAAVFLLSAGGVPTAAQAFPLLKKPASPLGAHPGLAKRLHPASNAGIPAFESIHAFAGAGYSGGLSQVNVGGVSMICLAFTNAGGNSGRVGCSATRQAERDGITLTDGVRFVVLVPAGGSVEIATGGHSTAVPVDGSGIASGTVERPAILTVRVGGSITTTNLPDASRTPDRRQSQLGRYPSPLTGGSRTHRTNGISILVLAR